MNIPKLLKFGHLCCAKTMTKQDEKYRLHASIKLMTEIIETTNVTRYYCLPSTSLHFIIYTRLSIEQALRYAVRPIMEQKLVIFHQPNVLISTPSHPVQYRTLNDDDDDTSGGWTYSLASCVRVHKKCRA